MPNRAKFDSSADAYGSRVGKTTQISLCSRPWLRKSRTRSAIVSASCSIVSAAKTVREGISDYGPKSGLRCELRGNFTHHLLKFFPLVRIQFLKDPHLACCPDIVKLILHALIILPVIVEHQ